MAKRDFCPTTKKKKGRVFDSVTNTERLVKTKRKPNSITNGDFEGSGKIRGCDVQLRLVSKYWPWQAARTPRTQLRIVFSTELNNLYCLVYCTLALALVIGCFGGGRCAFGEVSAD